MSDRPYNHIDTRRQAQNAVKYPTKHNYNIKTEELRLVEPRELLPLQEVFYNNSSEPKTFSRTLILDKKDFPDGIDDFRKWVVAKLKRKELFVRL